MSPSAIDHDVGVIEEDVGIEAKILSLDVNKGETKQVAFGAPDSQWIYDVTTSRFDLSRGSDRKIIVNDESGWNNNGFIIDPEQSVLVIVDMQNFFINPKYMDHPGALRAVDPLLSVIKKCRTEDIQVAWVNWGLDDKDMAEMPPAVQRGFNHALIKDRGHGWHIGVGSQLPGDQGRCLYKGTKNADIYEPLKQVMTPQDVRFDKARMSALWNPEAEMHKWLRESGKKTLIFAGVNTDQCLYNTLTDALNYGFDCILLSDCSATMTGYGAHDLTQYNIEWVP